MLPHRWPRDTESRARDTKKDKKKGGHTRKDDFCAHLTSLLQGKPVQPSAGSASFALSGHSVGTAH